MRVSKAGESVTAFYMPFGHNQISMNFESPEIGWLKSTCKRLYAKSRLACRYDGHHLYFKANE